MPILLGSELELKLGAKVEPVSDAIAGGRYVHRITMAKTKFLMMLLDSTMANVQWLRVMKSKVVIQYRRLIIYVAGFCF